MFKKTASPLTPATIMNDDARKAAAVKEINRMMIKFVVVKTAITVAAAVAAVVVSKALEAGAEEIVEN